MVGSRLPLRLRWLGVAGVELECDGIHILVDPFLSRPRMRFLFGGRPVPDCARINRTLPACHAILVSHAHYDHMMDVPYLAMRDDATVFGSGNVCKIVQACGVAGSLIKLVEPGMEWEVGPFKFYALEGRHGRIFGIVPYCGALPTSLRPPLRPAEFRMDRMNSYLVEAGGKRILFWNKPDAKDAVQADILILLPHTKEAQLKELLARTGAMTVIPIHWDNFFASLDRPPSEFLLPGSWPFRKASLKNFLRLVARYAPYSQVRVPVPFSFIEIPA